MKQKLLNKLWLRVGMIVAILTTAFAGTAWAADVTTTYVFTGKTWTATLNGSAANWTSGKDGAGYSNNGIQVTTRATGANGTSPISFTDVTKIVVTYNTNTSQGAGSIVAKIGDNDATTNEVGYSGDGIGTIAKFTTEFNYATPQSGNVKLTVNTTTNSIYLVSVAITCTSGDTPPATTYTVTYNANGGTGTMTDPNSPYNAGATVTVLGNEFTRDGHTFSNWNTAENGSGTPYDEDDTFTINANTTLYAQWTAQGGSNSQALAFSFTSNPGDWPTAANAGSYTYTLDGEDYTFSLGNNVYINGSYLMLKPTTSLGLPAIEGYKLTKVVASNSSQCSTSTQIGISSSPSSASYVDGGAIQTWSTTNSSYTYNLTSTEANTMYYLYVTNKNAQVTGLTLTYEVPSSVATPTFAPAGGTYVGAQNVTISCATEGASIYYTTDGTEPTNTSTPYSSAISVTATTTIKAIAYVGTDASDVATAAYTILAHAGTEADPYTVADAIAAIDAGTGTQDVYATGIVSAIPTAWNSQYSNITFNFVDNAGDEAFLQAYRCVSGENIDASTVAVGDIVVVCGNLKKYTNNSSSTYQFEQYCQLVSLTHPVSTEPSVTVTPATIDAPFAGTYGSLALAYENITNFISFDYSFCDANGNDLEGNDPDWIYAEINEDNGSYTLDYIIDANNGEDGEARTAYIKVYTLDDNAKEVYAIVTINQAKFVADYATLPFSFNGGKADIEDEDGLTQEGLANDYANPPYLKFDGSGDYLVLKINECPGVLTFDIQGYGFSGGTFKVQTSEDGTTYTDLETYTELGTTTQTKEFDDLGENVRYIKWIYTTKSSGNVALGNIALAEWTAPATVASITVAPATVSVDADEHDGTLALTYENLTITDMGDFEVQYYDAEGNELDDTEEPDWLVVLVAEQDPQVGEGYVVSYALEENTDTDARPAYFKVYAMDDETNLVYSNLVTINQAAASVTPPASVAKYVKVTSTADITSGQYLIVYEEGSVAFDGSRDESDGNKLDAVGNTIGVIISNGEIAVTDATAAAEFTINTANGTIKSASGYYIGQNSDANGLVTDAVTTYSNTISISEGYDADIVSSGGAYLRYNSNSDQTRFRYFKSSTYTGQKAIKLYKRVSEAVTVSAAGYATFASDNALDFTGMDATVKAYIATANGATGVYFAQIHKVPANTGVLLVGTEGTVVNAIVPCLTGDADPTTGNVFVPGTGAAVDSESNGMKNYVLSSTTTHGVGFYPASGKEVAVGKAYISVPATTQVKGFITLPGLDDDPTGITEFSDNVESTEAIYNVAGQRVGKMQKGIYIVNGKKVLK